MTFLSRKSKLGMNDVALFEYFNTRLEETTECPNKRCTCIAILGDASARASIAKYMTWFAGILVLLQGVQALLGYIVRAGGQ